MNTTTSTPPVVQQRIVSPLAMRPASTLQECFYCHEPIGGQHKPECVLLKKRVKVRMIAEYEIDVPNHWNKHNIEFHRNEGSWCADNAIEELEALAKAHGCLCGVMRFEYIEDTSGEMLEEG